MELIFLMTMNKRIEISNGSENFLVGYERRGLKFVERGVDLGGNI